MITERDIALDVRKFQHRTRPLRQSHLGLFSAKEIAIVDKVIDALRDKNADETSDLSHLFLGWEAAYKIKESTGKSVVIPYETVYISNEPMDEFDHARILGLAEKHGWATR